jgi:hypothetical protein
MPDFNELVKNLYTSKNRELTPEKLDYINKTYKGKETDFVKNFYTTIGEELQPEKLDYISKTYLSPTTPQPKATTKATTKPIIDKKTGFPIIDTNSVAPNWQELKPAKENPIGKEKRLKQELQNIKVTPENMDAISAKTDELSRLQKENKTIRDKKVKEENKLGFGEASVNRLNKGIASFSKSIYDSPKMILDAIYAPQNYIADKFDIPDLKVDPKAYEYENVPSKNMDKLIKSYDKQIKQYKTEIGESATQSYDKGEYGNMFKHAVLNSLESAPLMAVAIATGGESLVANALVGTSAASSQYATLNEENPEMSTNKKLLNAGLNGALEVVVGKFMDGVTGNVWRQVLAEKGAKATTQLATNGFKKTMERIVGKSPIVGVAGEYLEERITDGLQQLTDINTGAKTEFDWEQNREAGFSSLGFSVPNSAAIYSTKAYVSNATRIQAKNANKQIMQLQRDLENPNLNGQTRQIIENNIQEIYKKNKAAFGAELKKLDAIPAYERVELQTIDNTNDELQSQAIDIKYDNNISDSNKAVILNNLKLEYKKNLDRKNEILTRSKPEIEDEIDYKANFEKLPQSDYNAFVKEAHKELKNPKATDKQVKAKAFELYKADLLSKDVSSLPFDEQEKYKRDALHELMNEKNPDGTKNITYTNKEIVQRANENFAKNNFGKPKETTLAPPPENYDIETEVNLPLEAPSTQETTAKPEVNSPLIADVLAEPGKIVVYNGQVGNLETQGEQLVFTTPNSINELGNINELSNKTLDELGITTESIEVNDDNSVTINGETFTQPATKSIKKDKKGNYIVTLVNEQGAKVTFKGTQADEIVYKTQLKLNEKTTEPISQTQTQTEIPQPATSEEVIQETPITDETISPTNTPTDGNIQSGTDILGESGTEQESKTTTETTNAESVQSTNDTRKIKTKPKVIPETQVTPVISVNKNTRKVKLSPKGLTYSVTNKNGTLTVVKDNGMPVSSKTKRAVIAKYADSIDLTSGDKFSDNTDFNGNEEQFEQEVAVKSKNPAEIAETILSSQAKETSTIPDDNELKNQIIFDKIVKIKPEGFYSNKDRNYVTPDIKKTYFDDNGRAIDDLADEMSLSGTKITPEDIANFMVQFPKGKKEYVKIQKEKVNQKNIKESNTIFDLKTAFTKITGLPATPEMLNKAVEQQYRKDNAQSSLDLYTDEEIEQYSNEFEQSNREYYGKETNDTRGTNTENTKNENAGQEGSRTESETRSLSTEERIQKEFAKIDAIRDKIKSLNSIHGIRIKAHDVEGLNQQGIDLIDVIADISKQMVAAGIKLDVAINSALEEFKDIMDSPISYEDITERIKLKAFKAKPGVHSVSKRLLEGGNTKAITQAIKASNINYEKQDQKATWKKVEQMFEDFTSFEMYQAIKERLITGEGAITAVYGQLLEKMPTEIETELAKVTDSVEKNNLSDAYYGLLAEISKEFAERATEFGQANAMMNMVYQKSENLKYNLDRQLEFYKAANNGKISPEVLQKFEEADQKIQELNKRIKELEIDKANQEAIQALANMQAEVERSKQANAKATPKQRAKATADKIREFKIHKPNSFSSGTPGSVAWDLGVEAIAKSVEAGGTIQEAILEGLEAIKNTKWYKSLSKAEQNQATQDFNASFEQDKQGEIKAVRGWTTTPNGVEFPSDLFRQYVEEGMDDIDKIAARIKEDIADEFPDAEIRDIRDGLTNYGITKDPPKDEIAKEMARLRSLGKLLSALEDVMAGKMPSKSGFLRKKPDPDMRALRKEINAIMKEKGLDSVDLEKKWASALTRVHNTLANQIEELEIQIKNEERRKVDRTSVKYDDKANQLKAKRDALREELDNLVGKPELTDEQKLNRATKSLQSSIEKLEQALISGEFNAQKRGEALNSPELEQLRAKKAVLLQQIDQVKAETGLVEKARLEAAKNRIRVQLADYQRRLKEGDFSKKERTRLKADEELRQLKEEKIRVFETYDAERYKVELANRTIKQKVLDGVLEGINFLRIASGLDLGLMFMQLGPLTVSRRVTNPKKFAQDFAKIIRSIGSEKYSKKMNAELKARELYPLAEEAKLALTSIDYKMSIAEEKSIGDLASAIWNAPLTFGYVYPPIKEALNKERRVAGDILLGRTDKEKLSIAAQWKNSQPYKAVERGLITYANILRMEEFERGAEMLRMEGKNQEDHFAEYKKVASAVNTLTGRANLPYEAAAANKVLTALFYSPKNMVSIVNQVNPFWYASLQYNQDSGLEAKKITAANKIAIHNMARYVAITTAFTLLVKAAYGDDMEELEWDPRSYDAGKIIIKGKDGNVIIFDPFAGKYHQVSMNVKFLLALLDYEGQTINTRTGELTRLENQKGYGARNVGQLGGEYITNKLSPAARFAYDMATAEFEDFNGERRRVNPFTGELVSPELFNKLVPMYWEGMIELQKEDPSAMTELLGAAAIMGINTSVRKPSKSKKTKSSSSNRGRGENRGRNENRGR